MKYLKTYNKLFENNSKSIILGSDDDFNKINHNTHEIIVNYDIKNWPELPNHITGLNCNCCNITSLPNKLPTSLKELFCYDNKLTTLPELPNNLVMLSCHMNNLTELPILPNSLQKLYCDDNNLKELPTLPKNLKDCEFYNNPLEKLPKGMTKDLLNQNRQEWITDNVIKWLINDPSCFDLIRGYLTMQQINLYKKVGVDGFKSMDQFGMFGLKNDK